MNDERASEFRGYVQLSGTIVAWSIFPILSIALFTLLMITKQGQELLRIAIAQDMGFCGYLLLATPFVIWFGLIGYTAHVTALAGRDWLFGLCYLNGVSREGAWRLAGIRWPLCLGIAPTLVAWIAGTGLQLVPFVFQIVVPFLAVAITVANIKWRRKRPTRESSLPNTTPLLTALKWGTIFFLLIVTLVIATTPMFSMSIGGLGAVILGLAFWSSVLTLAFVLAPLRAGLSSLSLLAPVLFILLAANVDSTLFPHREVRIDQSQTTALHPLERTLERTFAGWLATLDLADSEEAIPVFLVAAEGGGLRSANWTAMVLAKLNEQSAGSFARHTFGYSTVSGASVGVLAFVASLRDRAKSPEDITRTLDEFLSKDYLAPLLSRLFVTEPLRQLLGNTPHVVPRDLAFENTLSTEWIQVSGSSQFAEPFAEVFAIDDEHRQPALFVNTTNLETGLRLVISNVDFGSGGLSDFVTLTPGLGASLDSLTVAEVAHLSARFPLISPPASLKIAVPSGGAQSSPVTRVWGRIADGGYFDNSGALTLAEVFLRLDAMRQAALSIGPRPIELISLTSEERKMFRRLAARVQFHVVMVRNSEIDQLNDLRRIYPALARDSSPPEELPANNLAAFVTDTYSSGILADLLLERTRFSEYTAPLEGVMSARRARSERSMARLKSLLEQSRKRQWDDCVRRTQEWRIGQSYSELDIEPHRCIVVTHFDSYSEVSLAHMLANLRSLTGRTDSGVPSTETIALGWVLSDPSRELMKNALAAGLPGIRIHFSE